jgi:hypothetical protein
MVIASQFSRIACLYPELQQHSANALASAKTQTSFENMIWRALV